MKIEYKGNTNLWAFETVEYGEVFKYKGNYYMRIMSFGEVNAVNIEDGAKNHFDANTEVEGVNGKFVIE